MDDNRLAQIRVTRDGTAHCGSGYRVTARTVLTCAHVLAGASAVEVYLDPGGPAEWSAPARVPWRDDANDLAVLTINPADAPQPDLPPCAYGRLPEDHAVVEVTTAGYPRWKWRWGTGDKVYRDLHVAIGQINTLANRRSGRLEITVPPPLESPDPAVSPWEGMSGAAVLADDRVVGVVVEHHRDESARRLTGVRIERALQAAGARRAELSALLGLPGAVDPPVVAAAPVHGAGAGSLAQIAEEFAALVQAELSQELERLQVYRPYPLPVSWQPGPDGDVLATYRRVPSGRLTILGDLGGGKTVLALRLAHALLDERRPGNPVPVVFALRTWNPRTAADLRHWLADTLAEQYAALRAKNRWHNTLARELVNQRRILPVLDGLDEMAPNLRAAVIKRLPGEGPLIVTSTIRAYNAAVATAGPVPDAAEITVTGVAADELARYLPKAGTNDWTLVVERLAGPDPAAAAVRDALRTPLAIALARDVYRTGDPTLLFDTAAAGGSAAVERHLVNAFIPTVYSEPLRGPQLKLRRTSRAWHAEDEEEFAIVGRHVRTLARLAGPGQSRGAIAWWRLYAAVPRGFRALVIGAVYLFAALAGVLLAQGVYYWAGGRSLDTLRAGLPVVAVAAVIGAVRAARDKTMPVPVHTRLRFRGRILQALITFVVVFFLGKALLLPVKAAALAAGQMGLLALVVVLSWGIGLAFAGTYALRWFIEVPLDLGAVPSTPASFAASRRSLLLTSAVVLVSTALGLGGIFVVTLHYLLLGLMLAAFAAPVRLAIAVVSTAYGRFCLVTRPYFALTGRLPWRVLDFLDDALCRGVLRQVGPIYLFRHERLRRALLSDPPVPQQDGLGRDGGHGDRRDPVVEHRDGCAAEP